MTAARERLVLDELQNNPSQVFAALHNVRLVDVSADEDGNELLHVESESGERAVLKGSGKVTDWRKQEIGQIGGVRRIERGWGGTPARECYFHSYSDQSLRRAPELDFDEPSIEGRKPNVIGWRCDAKPRGFRAPVGLIPGKDGHFIEDRSVSVTLRVPHEFVEECKRYGMTPEEMLQGFACDAAGIMNYVVNPRADGFGSNGSDERDMADAWMQRAYFAQFEEAEEAAAAAERLEEERERAEERAAERDDFGWLLDQWMDAGGDAAELFKTVEQLITDKEAQSEGDTGDGRDAEERENERSSDTNTGSN